MMSEYQLTATESVIRTADGAYIPNDPANRDWQEYQTWLAAGGVPDPYVPPPDPPPPPPDPNARITAGVAAAIDVTQATREIPADDFAALQARVQTLEDALNAMCAAQMGVQPAPAVKDR
jgi:hypothetical protein